MAVLHPVPVGPWPGCRHRQKEDDRMRQPPKDTTMTSPREQVTEDGPRRPSPGSCRPLSSRRKGSGDTCESRETRGTSQALELLASARDAQPQRNAATDPRRSRSRGRRGGKRGAAMGTGRGRRLRAGRPLQPVCSHAMPTPTLLAPNSPWLSLLRALAGRALECLILSSCCLLWEVLPDDLRPSRAIPLPALGPTSL